MSKDRIVVAGAGAIGCFVGGLLAAGGHPVTLLGRARVLQEVADHGLTLTDYAGMETRVSPQSLALAESPRCLDLAGLVLVTVKTGATAEMAHRIAAHAPASAPVISLQNGLEAIARLADELPGRDLRAGMVPFNVVPMGQGRFHRSTSGDILIEAGPGNLARRLSVPGLAMAETAEITAMQWGKLLLNLNNALNALSGLPLQEQLLDRGWRRLMADQMAEALTVLHAAGIPVKSTTPVPPGLIPSILRLPTPLFRRIAAQMLTIDPEARTSMAHDLDAGRATEIGALQGEIARLGGELGVATPIASRVEKLVRRAEQEGPDFRRLDSGEIARGA